MWAVQFPRTEVGAALRRHVESAANPKDVVLRGTELPSPRCDALRGEVGVATSCAMHAVRPSPCRAVRPSWEDGTRDPSCDEARQRHGLQRLTLRDWR
jgi:uncharacterized protein